MFWTILAGPFSKVQKEHSLGQNSSINNSHPFCCSFFSFCVVLICARIKTSGPLHFSRLEFCHFYSDPNGRLQYLCILLLQVTDTTDKLKHWFVSHVKNPKHTVHLNKNGMVAGLQGWLTIISIPRSKNIPKRWADTEEITTKAVRLTRATDFCFPRF